jgi:hypothetical protein
MSDIFYVYIDMKPDGEPFYVGKGNGRRDLKKYRNKWHAAICDKYPEWSRERVFEGTEAECFAEEKRLVAFYGRRDLGLGTLVNLTDGGEGSSGLCAEAQEKRLAAITGKPLSAEHRAKISAAQKGRPLSAEHRAKLDGHFAKLHAAKRGKPVSAETRAKLSEAHKGKKISPETRAKLSAANKGKTFSAEARAKVSAGVVAYYASRRAAAQAIADASAQVSA